MCVREIVRLCTCVCVVRVCDEVSTDHWMCIEDCVVQVAFVTTVPSSADRKNFTHNLQTKFLFLTLNLDENHTQ